MLVDFLCWLVGFITGAYLTHGLQPIWCRLYRYRDTSP